MANLWNTKGLPHKGWLLDGYEDIGEREHTCEMCGQIEIRYVHFMIHPEGHSVSVGCVCAQKMTDDYTEQQKIKDQNDMLKSRWKKRQRQRQKLWDFAQLPYQHIRTLNLDYKQNLRDNFYCSIRRYRTGWRFQAQVSFYGDIFYKKSMFEEEIRRWVDMTIKNYIPT